MPTATRLPPTARQRQIYEYIVRFWGKHTYPPSLRQIGAEFGISSVNGVVSNLRALAAKGFLVLDTWTARGIVVPELLEAAGLAAKALLKAQKEERST